MAENRRTIATITVTLTALLCSTLWLYLLIGVRLAGCWLAVLRTTPSRAFVMLVVADCYGAVNVPHCAVCRPAAGDND